MLDARLADHGLKTVGRFSPRAGDKAPSGTSDILLIGAAGAAMWDVFNESDEYLDGLSDPLDRWSRRILTRIAAESGATALFPFGGPPWQPFLHWSARGEQATISPIAMQISPTRGLWMSYRGALAFKASFAQKLQDLGPVSEGPCSSCMAPCKAACPVDAFSNGSYDVARCIDHITSSNGSECSEGCRARRACPVGEEPPLEQRRFHMEAFISAHTSSGPRKGD